ncbi:MAG: acetylglutamate kinase, partial [Endomicrobiia bacterium]
MKILIKLSGKIIDHKQQLDKFVLQIKKLYLQKNKIIIVHGGGKQVSLWMEKLNLEPKFING